MYAFSKRLLDLITALLVLLIFSPVFLIAPILIKKDGGPVLYRQRRVGKDSKEFMIYKFRSMSQDADEVLKNDAEFKKRFKKKSGWKVQSQNDPRITKIGHLLRKFSLDELPQVFNILRGEMSMVGPRAYRNDDVGNEIEEQLKLHPGKPQLRKETEIALTVKPGLTGPWQTSGRNELPWDERVRLDAEYAKKRSIFYDHLPYFQNPIRHA